MAWEPKRGCGFRKLGGLYLVGGGISVPCDRLPLLLETCPCCGQGIKPAMGWTWVDVKGLVSGPHLINDKVCKEFHSCIFCGMPEKMGRSGLLWIGNRFYKSPDEFIAEGRSLGFSRRIRAIPRGFKAGETYVLLAHRFTVRQTILNDTIIPEEALDGTFGLNNAKVVFKPGVFYVWLPSRIEKIYPQSLHNSDQVEDDMKRGITPVFFPDEDTDHQGSVYDKSEQELKFD